MYFQLKVNYYSNEANKNKYKNFELMVSTKNKLKISEERICCLDLKVLCCLDLWLESIFLKCNLCLLEQDISRSIFISIRYT